jgi:hypothetical protein
MKLKQIVTVVCLTIGGCYAMHLGQNEIAGVCFGAIASWGLINGVKNEIQKKEEPKEDSN